MQAPCRVRDDASLCQENNDDFLEFEDAAVLFIENARRKARDSFHNVGHHRAIGSLAAMLSAGGSVRKNRSFCATYVCL